MTDLVPQEPEPQKPPKKKLKFPIHRLYQPAFYIGMTFLIWLAGVIFSPLNIADDIIAEIVWGAIIAIVEIKAKNDASKK